MNSADWLEFRMTSWRLSICGWAWMFGFFVGIPVMLGAPWGVLALWMGASMDAGRLIASGIRGSGLALVSALVGGGSQPRRGGGEGIGYTSPPWLSAKRACLACEP